jgi:tetratricopeptide (TPR) repeat protein
MTRKRAQAKPRRPTAEPRPGRPRRSSPRTPGASPRWAWLALALLAVAAMWWSATHRPSPGGRSIGAAKPSPELESLARQAPQALHRRAVELGSRGRHGQSLPYYRRALEDPGAQWSLYCNYGSALQNATLEVRLHLGRTEPAVRSSFERARMLRQALEEFDRGEALEPAAADRASLVAARAQLFATAGLPWDALSEFRQAQALAPRWQATGDWVARSLREPCAPAR